MRGDRLMDDHRGTASFGKRRVMTSWNRAPRRAVPRARGGTSGSRAAAVFLAVSMVAGIAASCTPPPTDPPAPNQQFCEFWDKVEDAPPTADQAVLVKDEVVALADETAVTGQECTDSGARVDLDGAVLAEGEEVPEELGDPQSPEIAAVTGDEIGAEAPVLENLKVKALSATIGANGITVRGNVAVTLSGVTSTIGFTGTLSNLDNWSVSLSSSGFTIPGVVSSPVVFSGTLKVTNGVPSLSLSASATLVEIGDITVNGGTIALTASPTTGVKASVAGTLKIGPSTASGTVQVSFDKAGALVSAHADIAAHLVGYQAGGKKIDLQGTVKLDGNAEETLVSFSGSGVLGDLVVNAANGDLTLATNKATFVGVLDIAQGANSLRYNGSIVWDGNTAYTPFLTLEGEGEISGTLADGQTVTASGTLEATVIGGQMRTVLTGAFKVGALGASGSAIVEVNGATTALYLDADLVGAGFAAGLEGAVVITDGLAEQVSLNATVDGTVDLGDVTLNGATLNVESSYGSPLDISFNGGLKVGANADLTGSVDASFGPNGSLLSLSGNLYGSLQLDSWGLVNFNGSVIASPEQVTLSGSGALSLINFPAGITFNGSFTSSLSEPTWSLNGTARFRIASIEIASARARLSHQAGMQVTRAGFYFSIVGIPTYFEGNFHLKPGGGCTKVDITGGSFLARPILALALPGVVGCPVNI